MQIKRLLKKLDLYSDYLVFSMATVGLFGSLYFSEVEKMPPCLLCWWQRIFMYPLVAIYAVGILRKDKNVAYYGIPLVLIGWPISFYQTLLQWGVIKEDVINCTIYSNVSCGEANFNWLGFINIPFMAFAAFTAMLVLMLLRIYFLKQANKSKKD
jgi:disulfide bond formation protein DsbB